MKLLLAVIASFTSACVHEVSSVAKMESSSKVEVIVIADIPYTSEQREVFEKDIKTAISDDVHALIHLGDFKSSKEPCSDEELKRNLDEVYKLLPRKTVYTAGDNDWTDCDKKSLVQRMSELQRLKQLTDSVKQHVGFKKVELREWNVDANEPFNTMWSVKNVLFATVHVVGTNNGRAKIHLDDPVKALEKAKLREKATLAWLDTIAEKLQKRSVQAVVIAMHADMYLEKNRKKYKGACEPGNEFTCDGHGLIRRKLHDLMKNAEKPVLLLHGDSKLYCFVSMNQETGSKTSYRFNGPGDHRVIDGAKLTIDTKSPQTFHVSGLVSGQKLKLSERCED